METLTTPNLPKGTKAALAKLAKKEKFVKSDGKPNVTALMRAEIAKMLKK